MLGKTIAVIRITQNMLFERVFFFYERIFLEWFYWRRKKWVDTYCRLFLGENHSSVNVAASRYSLHLSSGDTDGTNKFRIHETVFVFCHCRFPHRNILLNFYVGNLLLLYLQFLVAFTVYLTVLKQTVDGGPSNSSQTN